MANVLNRTTMQYLYSVNTPDYSVGDWVINPDLLAVVGLQNKYWKLTGDVVSEMTQAEKNVVDAALVPKPLVLSADGELETTSTDPVVGIDADWDGITGQRVVEWYCEVKARSSVVVSVTLNDVEIAGTSRSDKNWVEAHGFAPVVLTGVGQVELSFWSGKARRSVSIRRARLQLRRVE